MSSYELVTLVSSLAYAITRAFTADEAALLAALFTQLGDTMETIIANDALNSNDEKQ